MSRRALLVLSLFAAALVVSGATLYRLDVRGVRSDARTQEPTPRAMTASASARDRAPAPLGEPALRIASPGGREAAVRYGFDRWADGAVVDEAGLLPLKPRAAAGGSVTSTPHANGLAVRFRSRAILQSGPAEFLNPGTAPFRYGATIKLAPNETSNGANVVQKGFAVGHSQFKLQVDGSAGRPSCVLVGVSSPGIFVAESPVSVADGQWHRLDCARRSGSLTISVDGRVRAERNIPPGLSIVNADPLCVGGKGTSTNNDQFAGVIDDVYVSIAK